jgi:hypothetical protein
MPMRSWFRAALATTRELPPVQASAWRALGDDWTIILGSGLLFVGMLFVGAAVAAGLIAGQAQSGPPAGATLGFGRHITTLLNVYAMRMAAVFTLTTVTGSGCPAGRWSSGPST